MSFKEPKPGAAEEPESSEISHKVDPEFLPGRGLTPQVKEVIRRWTVEKATAQLRGDEAGVKRADERYGPILVEMGAWEKNMPGIDELREMLALKAEEETAKAVVKRGMEGKAADQKLEIKAESEHPSAAEIAAEAEEENWKLHGREDFKDRN